MKRSNNSSRELRQRAVSMLERTEEHHQPPSRQQLLALIHDLTINQLDLELQNEELRRTQHDLRLALEQSRQNRDDFAMADHLKFLSALLDTVPSPVYYLDESGTFQGCNQAYCQLAGIGAESWCGGEEVSHLSLLAAAHEKEDRELLANPGVQVYERQLAPGTRGERHLVFYKSTYLGANGRVAGLVGVIVDISERKRFEEERIELERQLLHGQKLESLGILTGGIAHDFNNLLTAILGNLDLALTQLTPGSSLGSYLENSFSAANRAADLVKQLVAYTGKGVCQIRELDLNVILRENGAFFRSIVPKNIDFRVLTQEALPPIMADPGQIQQVLMNLITNAFEAIGTAPGLVTISTGSFHLPPAPGHDAPAGQVFFEVSDNGCGMNEETRQRLFDPFFSTKFHGRGLGMAATQGIVKAHGGTISLDSEIGRGTTFRIAFPAAAGEPGRERDERADKGRDAETEATLAALAHRTVLVVDDEECICTLGAELVRHLGFPAVEASNGRQAINVFKEKGEEIGLVIMDLTMPSMDGVAAFRELKKLRPEVRVIMASGFTDQEVNERFGDERPEGFIQKPFRISDLRRVIETVME